MSQITLLTGPERRRRWRDEEKLLILKEAFEPPRVSRRLFGLSYAAIGTSSMAGLRPLKCSIHSGPQTNIRDGPLQRAQTSSDGSIVHALKNQ